MTANRHRVTDAAGFRKGLRKIERALGPTRPLRGRARWAQLFVGHAVSMLVVVVLACSLARMGGTPRAHPDTLTNKANYAMKHGGNPRFFRYPALILYLHGTANQLAERWPGRSGSPLLAESERGWRQRDRPGHGITVLFSVLGALGVYAACFLLTRSRALAALGGGLLVSSPLWNANAHFLTVDVPLAALCMLTLFASLYGVVAEIELDWRYTIGLGSLVGLATATKYSGLFVALPVLFVMIERCGSFWPSLWRAARRLFLAGLASLITFFLLNPFSLIEREAFIKDLRFELDHASTGHFGYRVQSLHHHVTTSLRSGWGWILIGLSLWGLLTVVSSRRLTLRAKMVLVSFPTFYAGLLASTDLAFQRYAVPLLPSLAVLAVYGLWASTLTPDRVAVGSQARTWRTSGLRWAMTVLALVGLSGNIMDSLRANRLLAAVDTRALLGRALDQGEAELGNKVIGSGGNLRYAMGRSRGLSTIRNPNVLDVMIMDSFSHDRYIYDSFVNAKVNFTKFANGKVLALSPFDHPRDAVPFSPGSLYSPYPPDLRFRVRPGPYIEIYVPEPADARGLRTLLRRMDIEHTELEASEGFYYRSLAHRWPGTG